MERTIPLTLLIATVNLRHQDFWSGKKFDPLGFNVVLTFVGEHLRLAGFCEVPTLAPLVHISRHLSQANPAAELARKA